MREDELNAQVGRRVRDSREKLGFSRRGLADRAGISERYLALLETGKANISLKMLSRIAAELGVKPDSFLARLETGHPHDRLSAFVGAIPENQRQRALELLHGEFPQLRTPVWKGIALTGVRGSGKSTLGVRLAQCLNLPFVAICDVIVENTGLGVGELTALGGQAAYRRNELAALQEVATRQGPKIVETSGNIVHSSENFEFLLNNFFTVWVKAEPEELIERVAAQGGIRSADNHEKSREELLQLISFRQDMYTRSHELIDTSKSTEKECIERLMALANDSRVIPAA